MRGQHPKRKPRRKTRLGDNGDAAAAGGESAEIVPDGRARGVAAGYWFDPIVSQESASTRPS